VLETVTGNVSDGSEVLKKNLKTKKRKKNSAEGNNMVQFSAL